MNSQFEQEVGAVPLHDHEGESTGDVRIKGMGAFALKGIWEPVPLAEVSVPGLAMRSLMPKAQTWVPDTHLSHVAAAWFKDSSSMKTASADGSAVNADEVAIHEDTSTHRRRRSLDPGRDLQPAGAVAMSTPKRYSRLSMP
mmetsp:Transcript_22081/g.48454  ORF Transcript_22081/g.48454 Transcript_22081/m.48454 type:complete len:141 (-) Transcript_22081:19-441(-)